MKNPPSLERILVALYAAERNAQVSSFWDGGWTVRLGDIVNGFTWFQHGGDLSELAAALDTYAREHVPRYRSPLEPL